MAMVLLGCGHIGFDATPDAATQADGGPVDALPAALGWTLVQTQAARTRDTAVTLGMEPLSAAHLIVVAVQPNLGGAVTSVTDDSGCNVYRPIAAAHAGCNLLETGLHIYYAYDSCPGASTIAVTAAESILALAAWEVAGMRRDDPLDAAAILDDQAASNAPLGPRITTSVDGAFVISVVVMENVTSGIHAGSAFTNDHSTFGNGWAHLTDAMAPAGTYQAQWDQPLAGTSCASAAAFQAAR
jgi:hypothetical protein